MTLYSRTFADVADVFRTLSASDYGERIQSAVDMLVETFRCGGKALVFGNGGSAADAQHIAGELVGRFLRERKGLPAISLVSDAAVLTCWSNDYTFDTVFARQIEALGHAADVAWAISTSGNSRNVIAGLKTARERGLRTIVMTGRDGGEARQYADVLLAAPANLTPRVQEVHLVTYHLICEAVETQVAESRSAPALASNGAGR